MGGRLRSHFHFSLFTLNSKKAAGQVPLLSMNGRLISFLS